ncbi:hypothetical protein Strvi_9527 (plasmid) [Streptomyces violaceusniger Tu 4113]|uniref:Uncharacterized protein n=1 Tax=Streptomyces violaceusniger (strain Tu 4113) TaxID=653045 RepID=G2PHC8_STRV4|nr:hypothetical protein Strvi_9527 [Streptomyces violaceusniger Tu 4113]
MTGFTAVVAVVALLTGYGAGRVRPWRRLGDWADDQIRFSGPWVQGGTIRQVVLVLGHFVTAPRTSWRLARRPTPEPVDRPERDPRWDTNRPSEGKGRAV